MADRTNCISWNKKLKKCNALDMGRKSTLNGSVCDMFNKDCPFYKTVKEQIEIELRCKRRCEKLGYEWKGLFVK